MMIHLDIQTLFVSVTADLTSYKEVSMESLKVSGSILWKSHGKYPLPQNIDCPSFPKSSTILIHLKYPNAVSPYLQACFLALRPRREVLSSVFVVRFSQKNFNFVLSIGILGVQEFQKVLLLFNSINKTSFSAFL